MTRSALRPCLLGLSCLLSIAACSGPQSACLEFYPDEGSVKVADDDPGRTLLEGVESFDVGGIPVLLKHTPGKPVISAGLYLRGGTSNLTPQTVGLEEMTLGLVTSGGSESFPRQALSVELDSMGTGIGNSTGRAYSMYALQSVRKDWDRSFALFADVLLSPAMPAEELELQRTRQVEFLKRLDEESNRYVSMIAQDLLFEDHPYSLRHWGTIENIERFTVEDLRAYHKKLMVKSRMLFVLVGDIERADIEAKLKATFAGLPEGHYEAPELPPFAVSPSRYATFDVPGIPTNYLRAFFAAPAPGHPDYYPMVVASAILSNRFFEVIRTQLNLSYAVYAGVGANPVNYGSIYLSSSQPMLALESVHDEILNMKVDLVPAQELRDQIEVFITSTYLSLETQGAQRNLLADAQLIMGDRRRSAEFISGVRSVNPEGVRCVMNAYVKNLQVGFYGDPALFDADLATSEPSPAPAEGEAAQ